MRYLVTEEYDEPFFTNNFDYENHWFDGITIYDLVNNTFTEDGKKWYPIKIDVL